MGKPNWWLFHNGELHACWYSDTKAQAKEVANAHVNIAKSRNALKKPVDRIYKKQFKLRNSRKGEHDA